MQKKLICLIVLGLFITGCVPPLRQATPTPTSPAQPESFIIIQDGQTIELIPGVNVAPEIYQLAKENPEFLAGVEWVLIDGIWEALAKGVTIPLEAGEPLYRDPPPTLMPGTPQNWLVHNDQDGNYSFQYPDVWYILPFDSSDGLLIMDAPQRVKATRWVSLNIYPNPEQASLSAWVAERGAVWSGQVLEQSDATIRGLPVLRQTLTNEDSQTGGPYTYTMIWQAGRGHIYLWTAWPGSHPGMLNLLEYIVNSFQAYDLAGY